MSEKLEIFQRGLAQDFGRKFELSSRFAFIENRPTNNVWGRSR